MIKVDVRNNNVDKAVRVLKKKLQEAKKIEEKEKFQVQILYCYLIK